MEPSNLTGFKLHWCGRKCSFISILHNGEGDAVDNKIIYHLPVSMSKTAYSGKILAGNGLWSWMPS